MPQLEQKAAPADCSDPHAGQVRWSGEPQSLQKRAPAECSAPHEGQASGTRRVYVPSMTATPTVRTR